MQQAEKEDHKTESRRGRVRRLLIEPLELAGFRKSAKVTAERHKVVLASLADDLSYMSDESIDVLRQMLLPHGQGRDHDIWPSKATITGIAERVEPRPVEELPGLIRWFRSVEGPRARREGTLVETWAWFHRNKRPPIGVERSLRERAGENRRKLDLYRDRMRRGVAKADETDWVRRYEDRLAYCEGLVVGGNEEEAA